MKLIKTEKGRVYVRKNADRLEINESFFIEFNKLNTKAKTMKEFNSVIHGIIRFDRTGKRFTVLKEDKNSLGYRIRRIS